MRAVDSGVIVAGFATWHEAHDLAAAEIRARPRVAAHALLEAYSVLTRLPAPHRAPAGLAAEFLVAAFPDDPIVLPAEAHRRLVTRQFVELGISGGACYDALIAETTRRAGDTLVTLDRRALATYIKIGCPAELLG